jgi:hypothetical protein
MSSLATQPRGDTDFGRRFLTPLLLGLLTEPGASLLSEIIRGGQVLPQVPFL